MRWLAKIKRLAKKSSRQSTAHLDSILLANSCSLRQEALDEAQVLTDRIELLRRLPKDGVVAEIGVAKGDFSSEILEINHPRKLFLIDAWKMAEQSWYGESGFSEVRNRFRDEIKSGIVEIRRGWSKQKIAELDDGALDWVYIDASHDFEAVKCDLELVKQKLKPNGLICGHDYVRWGRFGKRFGVVEAVNKFICDNDFVLTYITLEPNYNPSFAIARENKCVN